MAADWAAGSVRDEAAPACVHVPHAHPATPTRPLGRARMACTRLAFFSLLQECREARAPWTHQHIVDALFTAKRRCAPRNARARLPLAMPASRRMRNATANCDCRLRIIMLCSIAASTHGKHDPLGHPRRVRLSTSGDRVDHPCGESSPWVWASRPLHGSEQTSQSCAVDQRSRYNKLRQRGTVNVSSRANRCDAATVSSLAAPRSIAATNR